MAPTCLRRRDQNDRVGVGYTQCIGVWRSDVGCWNWTVLNGEVIGPYTIVAVSHCHTVLTGTNDDVIVLVAWTTWAGPTVFVVIDGGCQLSLDESAIAQVTRLVDNRCWLWMHCDNETVGLLIIAQA